MEYLASTRAAGYNDVDRLALRHWVHLAEPRRTTLPRAHLRRGRGQWDRCRLRRTERYAQFDRGFDTIENKPTSPPLLFSSPPLLPLPFSLSRHRVHCLHPNSSLPPSLPTSSYSSIWCTRCPPPPPRVPSPLLPPPPVGVPDRPRFRSRTCFHGFSNPVKFYSWPVGSNGFRPPLFFISAFISGRKRERDEIYETYLNPITFAVIISIGNNNNNKSDECTREFTSFFVRARTRPLLSPPLEEGIAN